MDYPHKGGNDGIRAWEQAKHHVPLTPATAGVSDLGSKHRVCKEIPAFAGMDGEEVAGMHGYLKITEIYPRPQNMG